MADRRISIKPFSRKAAGSLARRVLYASLALLGLPLLLHTFLLYHREYRDNVKDAFEVLSLLAESRALYIEQMIQNQKNILLALSDELPPAPEAREAFLAEEAQEYNVSELIYADLLRGSAFCQNSLCLDPTFKPFLKEASSQTSFVFINPFSKGRHYRLFVGRTLPSPESPKALFLIATETEKLLSRLSHLEDSLYPLRLSLIDESGLIFLSTRQGLAGKTLAQSTDTLVWENYEDLPNAWFLQIEREDFLAVKIPIEGSSYTLLADIPEKSIASLQMKDYFFRIATFLFFVCFLGGGIVIWFTYRVSRPLRSLGEAMQRIAEGASHVRFQADPMGFEINAIGLQLNRTLDALLEHQAQAERERLGRERLAQELRIGHQIQASMLPSGFSHFSDLEIAAGYLPAREVSGDFYDLYPREDGSLLIAIADAADKGISACLYSLSFRSMLRAAAAMQKELSAIVETANALLLQDTAESHFFITAWIALYEPKTRKLSYCSHGHPPAYARSASGDLQELSTQGMALGIQEIAVSVSEIILQQEDLLLLYTDGVIEAHDSQRELFGKVRLEQFMKHLKRTFSAQEIADQLLEEVHLFCASAPQSDDVTILAILQK